MVVPCTVRSPETVKASRSATLAPSIAALALSPAEVVPSLIIALVTALSAIEFVPIVLIHISL